MSFGESNIFTGFCAFYFNYSKEIYEIKSAQLLLVLITYIYPKSRGEISLASTDPRDNSIIKPGYYSVDEDVVSHSNYIQNFNRALETSYFKRVETK